MSPLTFVIKNVLTGQVTKAHSNNLKYANLDDWEISDKDQIQAQAFASNRPKRKSTLVVSMSDSSDQDTDFSDSGRPKRNISFKIQV